MAWYSGDSYSQDISSIVDDKRPHLSSNPAAVSPVHEGLILTGINLNRSMDK